MEHTKINRNTNIPLNDEDGVGAAMKIVMPYRRQ